MGPVSGLVLFLVIWFMTFLVVLPIKIQTQSDAGGDPHLLAQMMMLG
ncbi:MAG: DUF1467 family protein, partial [Pseudomonadota bacterium]